jgi:proline iminopeptidase
LKITAKICSCLLLILLASCAHTPKIRHSDFADIKPVSELKRLCIGGSYQWVMIRGQNPNNPVLLFLHGGPGTSEMPLLRYFNKDLEKYFTVVMWDQRGAGKSNYKATPDETFSLDQILGDTYEVTQYLKKRFSQPKIFLVGHSWGSILGILTIKQHPEDYYAYVGVGQVVNAKKNLQVSYDTINKLALLQNSKKEITKFAQFEISRNINGDILLKDAIKMYSWIERNARVFYEKNGHYQLTKATAFAPEFTIRDKAGYLPGTYRSKRLLWNDQFLSINFMTSANQLEVPVYFVQGTHDFITCSDITKEYVDAINAPHKEMVLFDKSAHCPIFEEPKKFNELLISNVRKHSVSQPIAKDVTVNATH